MRKLVLIQDIDSTESFGVLLVDSSRVKAFSLNSKSLDWQEWVNVGCKSVNEALDGLPGHLSIVKESPITAIELNRLESEIGSESFLKIADSIGDSYLDLIETTKGFGRRYAVKNSDNIVSTNVSTRRFPSDVTPSRQSIIEYKALAHKTDATYSGISLMFKGARAVWDPDIGPKGGWRCPAGSEYGGYITDRFGRGCGVGIIRRVGRALVNAGRGVDRLGGRLDAAGERRERERVGRAADRAQRARRTGGEAATDVARPLEGATRPLTRETRRLEGGRRSRRNIPEGGITGERIGEINDRLQAITAELDQLVDATPTPDIDERIQELIDENARLREERDGMGPRRMRAGEAAPTRRRVVADRAQRPERQRRKKPVRRPVGEGRREGIIDRAARRILNRERRRDERENRYSRVTDDALRRALFDNSPRPLTDGVDPEAERQKTEERAEILREMGNRGLDIPDEYRDEAQQAGVRPKREKRREQKPGQRRRDAAAMALERAARRVLRQDDTDMSPRTRIQELEDRIAELEERIEANEALPNRDGKPMLDWRSMMSELRRRRIQLERAREREERDRDGAPEAEESVTPDADAPETPAEVLPSPSRRESRDETSVPDEAPEQDVPETEEATPTPTPTPDETPSRRTRTRGGSEDEVDVPEDESAPTSARVGEQRSRSREATIDTTQRPASRRSVVEQEGPRKIDPEKLDALELDKIENTVADIYTEYANRFAKRMGVPYADVRPARVADWLGEQTPTTRAALARDLQDFDEISRAFTFSGVGETERMLETIGQMRPELRQRILDDAGIPGEWAGPGNRPIDGVPSEWLAGNVKVNGRAFFFGNVFTRVSDFDYAEGQASELANAFGEPYVIFNTRGDSGDNWRVGRLDNLNNFLDSLNDEDAAREVIRDAIIYRPDAPEAESPAPDSVPAPDGRQSRPFIFRTGLGLRRRKNWHEHGDIRDLNDERLLAELTSDELEADRDAVDRALAFLRQADQMDSESLGTATRRQLMRLDIPDGALNEEELLNLLRAYDDFYGTRSDLDRVFRFLESNGLAFDSLDEAKEKARDAFSRDRLRYTIIFDKASKRYYLVDGFGMNDRMREQGVFFWNNGELLSKPTEMGMIENRGIWPEIPETDLSNEALLLAERIAPSRFTPRSGQFRREDGKPMQDFEAQRIYTTALFRLLGMSEDNDEAEQRIRNIFLGEDGDVLTEDEDALRKLLLKSATARKTVADAVGEKLAIMVGVKRGLVDGLNNLNRTAGASDRLNYKQRLDDLVDYIQALYSDPTTENYLIARALDNYMAKMGLWSFIDGGRPDNFSRVQDRPDAALKRNESYGRAKGALNGILEITENQVDKFKTRQDFENHLDYLDEVIKKHEASARNDELDDRFRARQLAMAENFRDAQDYVRRRFDEWDSPSEIDSGYAGADKKFDEILIQGLGEFGELIDGSDGSFFRDRAQFLRQRAVDTPTRDMHQEHYMDELGAYIEFLPRVFDGRGSRNVRRLNLEKVLWSRIGARAMRDEAIKRGIPFRTETLPERPADLARELAEVFPRSTATTAAVDAFLDKAGRIPVPTTGGEMAELLAEQELLRDSIRAGIEWANYLMDPRRKADTIKGLWIAQAQYAQITSAIDDAPEGLRPRGQSVRNSAKRAGGTLSRLRLRPEYDDAIRNDELGNNSLRSRFFISRQRPFDNVYDAWHNYEIEARSLDRIYATQMAIAGNRNLSDETRARALAQADIVLGKKERLTERYAEVVDQLKFNNDDGEQVARALEAHRSLYYNGYETALNEATGVVAGVEVPWRDVASQDLISPIQNLVGFATRDMARHYNDILDLLQRSQASLSNRDEQIAILRGQLDAAKAIRERGLARLRELGAEAFEAPSPLSQTDDDFLPDRLRPSGSPQRKVRQELADLAKAREHLNNGGRLEEIPDEVLFEAVLTGANYVPDPDAGSVSLSSYTDSDGYRRDDTTNYRLQGNVVFREFASSGLDGYAENSRFFFEPVKDDRFMGRDEATTLWQVVRVTDKTTGDVWFLKASTLAWDDGALEVLGAAMGEELEIGLRREDIRLGPRVDMMDGYDWERDFPRSDMQMTKGRWVMVKHVGLGDHGANMRPGMTELEEYGEFATMVRPGDSLNENLEYADLARIVAIDIAINNEDRHARNLMAHRNPDGTIRLIPIDYGLAGGARGRAQEIPPDEYLDGKEDPMALNAGYNNIFDMIRSFDIKFPSEEAARLFEQQLTLSLQRLRDRLDIIFAIDRLQANGVKLTPTEIVHIEAIKDLARERLNRMLATRVHIDWIKNLMA